MNWFWIFLYYNASVIVWITSSISNITRKSMVSQNNIRKILMENENKFSNYSDNMKLNDNIIINDIKKQELKENKKRFSNETIKSIANRKTVRDNSDEIINKIYQKSKSITNLNSTEISSIVSKSKIKQNPKIKFQKSFNSLKYESNPDKFKLIKNNILHYATVMKYKYSHSTKKNIDKNNNRISEIRPVDNLILTSYYPYKKSYKIRQKKYSTSARNYSNLYDC